MTVNCCVVLGYLACCIVTRKDTRKQQVQHNRYNYWTLSFVKSLITCRACVRTWVKRFDVCVNQSYTPLLVLRNSSVSWVHFNEKFVFLTTVSLGCNKFFREWTSELASGRGISLRLGHPHETRHLVALFIQFWRVATIANKLSISQCGLERGGNFGGRCLFVLH